MAKKIIRDGEFYEEKGYEPLHSIDVEGYVKTDPKNYIISPQELAEILSGEGGSMIWSGTTIQDRIQNAVIGLTEDGKLNLGSNSCDVITDNMSVAEALTALANASCLSKTSIENVSSDIVSLRHDFEILMNDAPEAFDTLKEVSDWIETHSSSVTTDILSSLTNLDNKISAEASARTTLETSLTQRINDEHDARVAQCEDLRGEFNSLLSSLNDSITEESNKRISLEGNLNNEILSLKATDNELVRLLIVEQGRITNEISDRVELLNSFNEHAAASIEQFAALSSRTEEIATNTTANFKKLRKRVKAVEDDAAALRETVVSESHAIEDLRNALASEKGEREAADALLVREFRKDYIKRDEFSIKTTERSNADVTHENDVWTIDIMGMDGGCI